MIPRIIHYCWLSQDPIPKQMQEYVEGWHRLLSDYEFVFWDHSCLERFADVPWVSEAFAARKYAFAADYIRLYAVYTMGGVYMDMDVELLRPFDSMLDRPYLFGEEYTDHPEAGVFGAEPGCDLIRWCMMFYETHHFCPDQQTLTTCKAPQIIHNAIAPHHPFLVTAESPSLHPDHVCLLPHEYLTAMSADTGIAHPTTNTRTIHHFSGSWCYASGLSRLRRWCKVTASRCLGEKIVRSLRSLFLD